MVDKEFELLGEAFIDAQKEKVFEPYECTSSGATAEEIAAKREKLTHILYNARKTYD